jgi:hypothetical protein
VSERERFDFEFDPRFVPLLFAMGVTRGTAFVVLTAHDRLLARFGPWRVLTPLANVREVCLTGPYQWFKAIGPRGSMADRGATFGTTTAGGVCMLFHDPVPALDPFGVFRHPGLTVTVADREGLAEALRRRTT